MADPARDMDWGLAARLRWAALVLGSAMMMTVELACSLAISASKKSGRDPTMSSLFLLRFFQKLGRFMVVYPMGALAVLMFIAGACTFWSASGAGAHGPGLPLADGEEIVETARAADIESCLPRSAFDTGNR